MRPNLSVIGNGRFLVRQFGAERYLEPETVAVLITLRQALIADLPHATAANIMVIDAAVTAYYNLLRAAGLDRQLVAGHRAGAVRPGAA